ncbi:MAG: HD domain-containing protein [Proteobacteria bacterium]|nr:HD domain-containing protein [Pseudomonadota bacterium]
MDKDLISLLYVADKKNEGQMGLFSKANGFSANFCCTKDLDAKDAWEKPVDIILMDNLTTPDPVAIQSVKERIHAFGAVSSRFKQAFFLGVNAYPEFKARMALKAAGVDEFIVRPLSVEEVYARSNSHIAKKTLEQKQILQEQTLEKAFHYLDKFKQELKTVKKELIREKNSLNAALKQIHHMTRERDGMKKSISHMKETLTRNVRGFERLLSALITTRIEQNRGHGDRVGQIASFIAKQFGFAEKKLEDIRKAAMLHEVGLLFMPGEASEKQGNGLTNYEKNIWIQYPVKGADLLKECQGFEDAAEMIRFLNENADGTGFPDGLKKNLIPLGSRILAGADAFDRLKDSPDVLSLEDLMAALESLSGSRLDPAIVSWLEKYAVLHMGSDAHRVRGVGVEQLEPGMRLGTALFTSNGTKLFSVNTLLTQDAIDKIIQYHREYPVDEIIYIKA